LLAKAVTHVGGGRNTCRISDLQNRPERPRRHEKGWSQEVLAFECGLHGTFVAHVERLSRNILLDNFERLAKALGVETYELLQPRSDS